MTTPDPSEEEHARLHALERYGAIASLRGEEFDDLASLAAYICRTPNSLVTLVDSTRQWFLSSHGIQATDTSRDVSFCVHALISPDMLIVPDASADARFAANPLVTGEPFVRFYAGAPWSRRTASFWGLCASLITSHGRWTPTSPPRFRRSVGWPWRSWIVSA